MSKTRNILNSIFASVVTLAILLPSSINLAHSLENHNHYDLCNNPHDVHLHLKQLDCDLEFIQFNSQGVVAFAKATSFSPPTTFYYTSVYTKHIETRDIEKEPSRGPPLS